MTKNIDMWNDVLEFLKNPVYEEDENREWAYRFSVFLKLLGLALIFSIILGLLISLAQTVFDLDFGKHAIEEALEKYPLYFLFIGAVFLAPILEEIIFRGPLFFFKGSKYFKFFFHASVLIFGFYHMTNFEITSTTLLLSPLLVSPQLSVGVLLGLIRVRFGLLWAIALHAVYNLLLVGPVLMLKVLDIPLE